MKSAADPLFFISMVEAHAFPCRGCMHLYKRHMKLCEVKAGLRRVDAPHTVRLAQTGGMR